MTGRELQRSWLYLLVGIPVVIVLLAYAWLAVAHGTLWLWPVVVHEGGHYTFGQTVLFMRHHLREVPVDIAMALSLATAVRTVSPGGLPVPGRWFGWIAVLMILLAFLVSAVQEGGIEAARDLLQFRTRDDDTRYGSHWRFHFLSTIWFCSAAPLLAGITSGVPAVIRLPVEARRFMTATIAWLLLLTLFFGVGAEPFTSERYIGHQAREILTHGLITLPLVFGACVLAGDVSPNRPGRPAAATQVATWAAVAGIPLFLISVFGGTTLEESAQLDSGLSGVVAAHVFEHALDYLLVALMTLALVGRRTKQAS